MIAHNNHYSNFEPSLKLIHRIIQCLIKNGPETKTQLSHNSNMNYTRLVKHVMWLEKKGLVELTTDNLKVYLNLTDKGKKYSTDILDI
ncbi:MAG: winged helix-turn-helix domain-containing protein [Nitrosarchaeum sp.]